MKLVYQTSKILANPIAMEVDTKIVMSSGKGVECLLTDSEGEPLGTKLYLPENTGPLQLQQTVNTLLKNVINQTKMFLAFVHVPIGTCCFIFHGNIYSGVQAY